MSLYDSLLSNLQSINVDTRKKNADLKKLADGSLKFLYTNKNLSQDSLVSKLKGNEAFYKPFLFCCAKKIERHIYISLNSIQLLAINDALSPDILESLFNSLNAVIQLGQDSQLRVLQIIPIICTHYAASMKLPILISLFRICFNLHNSKNSVVSNAAAATLRQIVILVFDYLDYDTLAHKQEADLFLDSLSLFKGLCSLLSAGKSESLNVDHISTTFGLELLESILVNHHRLFQIPEFQDSVRKDLLPIITASLASMSDFPVALRISRILNIIFQHYVTSLTLDIEVIFSFIISSLDNSEAAWKKALFLEVLRSIFSNTNLLYLMYTLFDGNEGRKPIIKKLVTSLSRIVNEKPSVIGVGSRVVLADTFEDYSSTSSGNPPSSMEKVSGSFTGTKPEQIIGICRATILKTPCIEQFDKQEPPIIPFAYLVYLAMCSLASISNGIADFVFQFYEDVGKKEFTLLIEGIKCENFDSKEDSTARPQNIIKCQYGLISENWTSFLVAYSTFVSSALAVELLKFCLNSYVKFVSVCTLFGLETPRDALLTTLSNKAVPSNLLSGNMTHSASSSISHNGRLSTSTMFSVEGLKEAATTIAAIASYDSNHDEKQKCFSLREILFLRCLSSIAKVVGEKMGKGWKILFETFDKADIILNRSPTSKHLSTSSLNRVNSSNSNFQDSKSFSTLMDYELVSYKNELSELMYVTSSYSQPAYMEFLESLLAVITSSSVHPIQTLTAPRQSFNEDLLSANTKNSVYKTSANRSISGGIRLLRKSSEVFYSFSILETVCSCNLDRFLDSKLDHSGWSLISKSLSEVFKNINVAPELRTRAANCLANILVDVASRLSNENSPDSYAFQEIFFESLGMLLPVTEVSDNTSRGVEYDISTIGLEALVSILETVGHHVLHGWQYVFEMLRFNCLNGATCFGSEKGAKIVRLAFSCLQLICTDFLASLDTSNYLDLMDTLLVFCRQLEDANVSLTAVGLFWNVSDTLKNMFSTSDFSCAYNSVEDLYAFTSMKSKEILPEVLWIMLLVHLADLCENSWASVRNGAAQILFRIFNSQCSKLGTNAWASCCQLVIMKLLHSQPIQNVSDVDNKKDEDDHEQTSCLIISGIADVFSENMSLLLNVNGILDVLEEAFQLMLRLHSDIYPKICISNFKALRELSFSISEFGKENTTFTLLIKLVFINWGRFCEVSFSERRLANISQEGLTLLIESVVFLLKAYNFGIEEIKDSLLQVRKAVFYEESTSFALDVDFLSSLQLAVESLTDLLISKFKLNHLVLELWSDVLTYAFNEEKTIRASLPTLICLSKKIFENAENVVENNSLDFLNRGTMQHMFESLLVPMRLKYRCPKASRVNQSTLPIWVLASKCFVRLMINCFKDLKGSDAIEDAEKMQCLFLLTVEATDSIISPNADYEYVWSLEDVFENEDVSSLKQLHNLWKPHLQLNCLSDEVAQYYITLCKGSFYYQMRNTEDMVISRSNLDIQKEAARNFFPSTESPVSNRRQRIAVDCFSILLDDYNSSYEHVSLTIRPILQSRLCWSLKRYVADKSVSGYLPLSKSQEMDMSTVAECLNNHPSLYSNPIHYLLRKAYHTTNASPVATSLNAILGQLTLKNEVLNAI
ncbi:Guanyl-nucleotide exchange factor [Schizosaccharomyces pombe]